MFSASANAMYPSITSLTYIQSTSLSPLEIWAAFFEAVKAWHKESVY